MKNAARMKQALVLVAVLTSGCVLTTHAVKPSTLGTPSGSKAMLAVIDEPGPLTLQTVNSADWQVPLSGLLNLNNEKAKAAGKVDAPEPISVFFHVITHPTFGTFIVDTGVEEKQCSAPKEAAVQGIVAGAMKVETIKCHQSLAAWLKANPKPAGAFITHVHLDHIWGVPDLPAGTPIYIGRSDTNDRAFQNLVLQGTMNALLSNADALSEWQFSADPDGQFESVIDVFGDGSLFALWTPGHTPGSTSFVARTADGPVLMTGDNSHTAWGWQNEVEPGTFTGDQAQNLASLKKLRALAAAHPKMRVLIGHQLLK